VTAAVHTGGDSNSPASAPFDASLLKVEGLRTSFFTPFGEVKAVDGVSFEVKRGEIFGLVGESGCGKSITALSIMRLIDAPGQILGGEVTFDGQPLLRLSETEMTKLRGSRISMIFQQPQSSLNPVFTIGDQLAEILQVHKHLSRRQANERAVELLQRVDLPDPGQKGKAYPFELSGGQAQRVMIAMALALSPTLLIADEPTTALDVTIQAQILDLMSQLCQSGDTALILITHDLGVIAEMADRVAVMYAGRIVEEAGVGTLFGQPRHPYTQGLMASSPTLGQVEDRLQVIPGSVPDLIDMPDACRFAERCAKRVEFGLEICQRQEPDLIPLAEGHQVRCWLYQAAPGHRPPVQLARPSAV
jgi:oligopeptide/dipeptide ABC transporter ATP-binding protein